MEEHLVTFMLGEEEFALDIMRVQEIIKMPSVTVVPKAPSYIEGVMNLRGSVLPVINLKKQFGLAASTDAMDQRVIILQSEDKVLGLVVDRVTEVLYLRQELIEPPPPVTVGIDSGYIKGVGKINERLVVLLQTEKILNRHYVERRAG